MLFNSPFYIFVFLPVVAVVYFALNKKRLTLIGKTWLTLASIFFYSFWDPKYLFLIISSMLVNFSLGAAICRINRKHGTSARLIPKAKILLLCGLAFNLGLLGYYKYAGFFMENASSLFGLGLPALRIILPLGISFFTFTQIAYLVDCYRREAKEYDLLNYCLFVTFFPHLIAGPILHHHEMMPQFERIRASVIDWRNVSAGVFIFCAGLFKKIFAADSFAVWANAGFNSPQALSFLDAWVASLSYTFQLYYDFSGYSDMAIGAALIFNIRLPINFNSPYKSLNVRDFWQRWHMTLSRFLRDYIYIPLGGNRAGKARTYPNLLITFLLGGLWHGAGWTFVIWGALHGMALVLHRLWLRTGVRAPAWISWFCTFMFINASWVFFRAANYGEARRILRGMAGLNGMGISNKLLSESYRNFKALLSLNGTDKTNTPPLGAVAFIILFGLIAFCTPNTGQMIRFLPYRGRLLFKPALIFALIIGLILFYSLVSNIQNAPSEFLYFNF